MTDRATPEKDAPADPVVVWECGRHVHDYLDGDGFAYCQECTEATGDYVACRGDGAADAGHRLPEAPPSVR